MISRAPDAPLIYASPRRIAGAEEPDFTIIDLAQSEGVTPSYMTGVIRLAFLDPTIITRIVEGQAPAGIATKRLTQADAIPLSWNEQRQKLRFSFDR